MEQRRRLGEEARERKKRGRREGRRSRSDDKG